MTVATVLPSKLQKIRTLIHALNQQERRLLFRALMDEELITKPALGGDTAVPTELFLWEAPPIYDVAQLKADWWPEEETADDINEFVRQLRQEDLALEQTQVPDWEL